MLKKKIYADDPIFYLVPVVYTVSAIKFSLEF